MMVFDIIGAVAGVATALGVGVAAWQLREQRQQRRADFELRFSERYETIVSKIPLPVLLGISPYSANDETPRRAFYDYFELCELETYYREAGQITNETWKDWQTGIESNWRLKSFRDAWTDLSAAAPRQFELFREKFPKWNQPWPDENPQ
ncbi:MAG: hypothetical protein ABMA25_04000 [Ilumatobacteraceae bacterium]